MPSRAKRRRRRRRDLDVARVELDVAVQIAEGALVPDLDRAAVAAAGLPDPDALGVVAVGAEGARAAGADPLVAARVAPLLLREPLLERLHQLVPAAQRLDLRLVLGREQALELLAQPLLRDLGADVEQRVHALEIGGEREVVAVELRLVLDQRGAREMVEIVDRQRDDTRLQRLEQRQELARGHRQARGLQVKEEADQHRAPATLRARTRRSARGGSSSRPAIRAR